MSPLVSSLSRITLPAVAGLLAAVCAQAQTQVVRSADAAVRGFREADFPRVVRLADDVYALEDLYGAIDSGTAFTTNCLIVVTSEGVLIADALDNDDRTNALISAVRQITSQPIRYVVVASDHGDHIAGNNAFADDVTFVAHPTAIERIAATGRVPVPEEFVADRRELRMGDTRIDILNIGRGHTGSDLVVHLPDENILFMGELYFNRIYPSVGGARTAYPSEWIESVRRAEAMQAAIYVPGHGFVDSPEILAEELVNFRQSLENLVAEATRLHDQGVPVERAFRDMNLGRFQYWYRAANNMPDAVRQVYRELDGQLP